MKSYKEYMEALVASDAPIKEPPMNNVFGYPSKLSFSKLCKKIIDSNPNDFKDLLKRTLESGTFDDDPMFKKQVSKFIAGIEKGSPQPDMVSRPSADSGDFTSGPY